MMEQEISKVKICRFLFIDSSFHLFLYPFIFSFIYKFFQLIHCLILSCYPHYTIYILLVFNIYNVISIKTNQINARSTRYFFALGKTGFKHYLMET